MNRHLTFRSNKTACNSSSYDKFQEAITKVSATPGLNNIGIRL
jgi:hypothetical protein